LKIYHSQAHYEGFVKKASILFLKYVISTYTSGKEINDNIFALQMREQIIKSSKTNKCSIHVELIKNINTSPIRLVFKPEKIIDTHSNLKSEYLKEIMFMCGIRFDSYWEGKSFFIDNILLGKRNSIAHGEMVEVDDETVDQCLLNVMEILEKYKVELEGKL
jgi:hypothetical protein